MKNSAEQITKDETIENNKLIAEFMGLREENEDLILTLGDDEWYIDLSDEDTFKFDYDWNWLMPVVIKCYEVSSEESHVWEAIYYAVADLDMDKIYTAVVNFIKWYNENK